MRRTARRLQTEAAAAFGLAVELFNRPSNCGRHPAVLIHLDHSIELLLKGVLYQKEVDLSLGKDGHTLSFRKCASIALSNSNAAFIDLETEQTFREIHSLRGSAQHYLLDIDEALFAHVIVQGALAFRTAWESGFETPLTNVLPDRSITLATVPAAPIGDLFLTDVERVRQLMSGQYRKRALARQIMAPWAHLLAVAREQDDDGNLARIQIDELVASVTNDSSAKELLRGFTIETINTSNPQHTLALYLNRRDGVPVRLVDVEEEPEALMAIKEVKESDRYPLFAKEIAEKLKGDFPERNSYDVQCAVERLRIKNDPSLYKEFTFGSQTHKRYARKVLEPIAQLYRDVTKEELRAWKRQQA